MNIHSRDVDKEIERSEAQAALDVLRSFIAEKVRMHWMGRI